MEFNIGEKLKRLRLENNYTQQFVADAVNTTKSLISMYETNRRIPSRKCLCKLADLFGVSIDSIMGRKNGYFNSLREDMSYEYKVLPEIPVYENADDALEKNNIKYADENILFEDYESNNIFFLKRFDDEKDILILCEDSDNIYDDKTYAVNVNGNFKILRGEQIKKENLKNIIGRVKKITYMY